MVPNRNNYSEMNIAIPFDANDFTERNLDRKADVQQNAGIGLIPQYKTPRARASWGNLSSPLHTPYISSTVRYEPPSCVIMARKGLAMLSARPVVYTV